ncbi:uncharacterized protein LOC113498756 [Trichoplusia ni]|uniref:Uncharacterized protein LOC113498756 n=1 Tax=Trichoplusia ni TaxID=7111 RepID=A0A7E5W321_TRINI|nr:uncharacterized protein LOC113498756 [Trichoplusia ni]
MKMEEFAHPEILQNSRNEKEEKTEKISYTGRTNCGICCICRMPPVHSKFYYGHVFCTDCFYKYIYSPTKTDCSGDVTKKEVREENAVQETPK